MQAGCDVANSRASSPFDAEDLGGSGSQRRALSDTAATQESSGVTVTVAEQVCGIFEGKLPNDAAVEVP